MDKSFLQSPSWLVTRRIRDTNSKGLEKMKTLRLGWQVKKPPLCGLEVCLEWPGPAQPSAVTLCREALWAAPAFKCVWKRMRRSLNHPDGRRMFSPGLWEQRLPHSTERSQWTYSTYWPADYLAGLTWFVSTSSPRDHRSFCAFLSPIFSHLVENGLFDTGALWWSAVRAETCRALLCFRYGLGYLTLTAESSHSDSMIYLPCYLGLSELGHDKDIFSLFPTSLQGLRKI